MLTECAVPLRAPAERRMILERRQKTSTSSRLTRRRLDAAQTQLLHTHASELASSIDAARLVCGAGSM